MDNKKVEELAFHVFVCFVSYQFCKNYNYAW